MMVWTGLRSNGGHAVDGAWTGWAAGQPDQYQNNEFCCEYTYAELTVSICDCISIIVVAGMDCGTIVSVRTQSTISWSGPIVRAALLLACSLRSQFQ